MKTLAFTLMALCFIGSMASLWIAAAFNDAAFGWTGISFAAIGAAFYMIGDLRNGR